MLKIISRNLKDTDNIGKIIGKNIESGSVICLDGDLGAGKTTLTQSIAKGLKIDDYITSPTFTIIKEYDGEIPLYHMDVYRIEDDMEMYDIGYDEYIYSNGVCVIEWSAKIKKLLPDNRIDIKLNRSNKENERIFLINGKGSSYEKITKELIKYENTRN